MNQSEEGVVGTTREGCLCCPRRALYQEMHTYVRIPEEFESLVMAGLCAVLV